VSTSSLPLILPGSYRIRAHVCPPFPAVGKADGFHFAGVAIPWPLSLVAVKPDLDAAIQRHSFVPQVRYLAKAPSEL
jgi:hypothetical protein